MMKISDFTIYILPWGRRPNTPTEIIEVAKHAEDLGFYGVTMAHTAVLPGVELRPQGSAIWSHLPPEYRHFQYDALVLLPMVAAATSKIKIGINPATMPLLSPFAWAKYLATLDVASNGRLIAGFGAGRADNAEKFGINPAERGPMAYEALDIITRLWTADGPISFDGKYYKGVDLMVEPKPVQKPFPEIWWAGWNDANVELSAQVATRHARFLQEGAWTFPGDAFDVVKNTYIPALRNAGANKKSTAGMCLMLYANVLGENLEAKEFSSRYWDWPGSVLETLAVGTPDRCANVVSKFRKAGASHFVLDFHRHGYDHVSQIHQQMDRFVEDVLPLLAN